MLARIGFPEEQLEALGAHLKAEGRRVRLLVVGGTALRMRGITPRATQDVDVLAVVGPDGEPRRPDLTDLRPLVRRVARDFAVPADWLNDLVALQWQVGLPPQPLAGVEWRSFGGLEVGLAGRPLLIALKLFATCDATRHSVHCQDLLALAPNDEELAAARIWVLTQDASASWSGVVAEVVAHVQAHRLP